MQRPTVLILCTGNSCRSHMAEGILRHAAGDLMEVRSAGSRPAGFVHPMAVEVMQELGIDLSGHRSKALEEFLEAGVDTVITVCGKADQVCPVFPGQVHRYHWGFDDPAQVGGDRGRNPRRLSCRAGSDQAGLRSLRRGLSGGGAETLV